MKKFRIVWLSLLLALGGFSNEDAVLGAGNHTKEFPSDFDRLKSILQQPNSLSAATPDWLDMGIEHRTRYENV